MDGVFSRAQAELNDPMSPYYLGAPSTMDRIDGYLRRTNYFGPNARNYLAQPTCDSVEILERMRERRTKRNWLYGLGIAAAAVTAYLFRGKIPLIGKFLKKAPKA